VLLLRLDGWLRLVLPTRLTTSVRKFVLVGLAPFVGGLMFYGIGIYAITYYAHAANAEGKIYAGLTLPIWFGASAWSWGSC